MAERTGLDRRRIVLALSSACGLLLLSPAGAQNRLPDKDLRILVGFVSGGGPDTAARRIAQELERRTSRHVHVENRPGRSGAYVGEVLQSAPPDGSVVALIPSTTLMAKLSTKDFPFDPVRDLAPISMVGTFSLGFAASPTIRVSTFEEYVQWVKQGDDTRRRLGNTASDAFVDVLDSILGKAINVRFEPVSYSGATAMVNDLEDGRLPAAVSAVTSLLEHHRGHRLRLLMTSGHHRLRLAPDIPTARELGYPQLEIVEWFALFAPSATPPGIIEAWNSELRFVLDDKEIASQLAQLGLDADSSTPEGLREALSSRLAEWKRRMAEAGISPAN